MRFLFIVGLISLAVLVSALPVGADSVPGGSEYCVNEANDPLVLSFRDLKGELSFSLILLAHGNPAEKPWNVYLVYAGTKTRQDKQIQRIEFNTSYPDWVYITVSDPALEGGVHLRFVIDDFQEGRNALAAFRNFSSAPTYISGGEKLE